VQDCLGDPATKSFDEECLAEHGVTAYSFASYHPESRFWLFQAIEAGIFVAMALALLAFSVGGFGSASADTRARGEHRARPCPGLQP
jgi:hypothetical protein